MKVLILCESMFRNTRDVAMALAGGREGRAEAGIVEVGHTPDLNSEDVDLLIRPRDVAATVTGFRSIPRCFHPGILLALNWPEHAILGGFMRSRTKRIDN